MGPCLRDCADTLAPYGTEILPEIHEHYTIQQKLTDRGYPVYDFALPMLLLNAIYFGNAEYLANWLRICPRRQYTTLDTHDGIGVVDVRGLMPDDGDRPDQGPPVRLRRQRQSGCTTPPRTITWTSTRSTAPTIRRWARTTANTCWPGRCRCFAPGIPQVYYVGLLAGRNDLELLEKTKTGRDINRHYYSLDEVARKSSARW